MPPNSINVDIGIIKEKINTYENNIKSLDIKVERNSQLYTELLTKLDSRIISLEVENRENKVQINNLIEYKNKSEARIRKLEHYTSVGIGVVAVITILLGLILKGYLGPLCPK